MCAADHLRIPTLSRRLTARYDTAVRSRIRCPSSELERKSRIYIQSRQAKAETSPCFSERWVFGASERPRRSSACFFLRSFPGEYAVLSSRPEVILNLKAAIGVSPGGHDEAWLTHVVVRHPNLSHPRIAPWACVYICV